MGVWWTVHPWSNPWVIALDVVSYALVLLAVVHSWRSADRVVRKNRAWTRAWRILVVTFFSVSVNGLLLPFGAIYALKVYRVPARSRATVS